MIGSGATAAAALVAYSGLGSASAATHLMHDRPTSAPPSGMGRPVRELTRRKRRMRQAREEELIWMRDGR
jgi:hypothetical protein